MSETVSEQLIEQRVRNRIIEYLELAASAENQRIYERNVPIAVVPEEMIEHWSDLTGGAHINDVLAQQWIVFSDAEKKAMRDFHAVWVATCEATPMPMPRSIEDLIGTPVWSRFMEAGRVALHAFEARGRFSEDVEECFGS